MPSSAPPFDEDDLRRNFGRIWTVHAEEFTRLLVTLRQHFGGDLDRLLVLAVIGSRTLARGRIDGLTYEEFNALKRTGAQPAPINLQSISDYSGIPRETVRRKIRDLEEAGWVTRHPDGFLTASIEATRDLAPLTEATMRYLQLVVSACLDENGRN